MATRPASSVDGAVVELLLQHSTHATAAAALSPPRPRLNQSRSRPPHLHASTHPCAHPHARIALLVGGGASGSHQMTELLALTLEDCGSEVSVLERPTQ
jgi:hypothetical protein